ncbi:hypothetical protein HDE76_003475 [Rhodanobacter sp. ANJX3]|uniref:hypothetical protein n=1 Tax=unclassified Rhodanobacter TaxID=2621553 RepID=UPI0015CDB603|nr:MULTISPECIES: hypothetical protein [unclassified Rhodanobacter]MBB5360233.1 hypothetical protein [Rhodanobacter sp. ANJX3]NYE29160.1 hypothetical protein [Rhodanobacter sp. K2T2]
MSVRSCLRVHATAKTEKLAAVSSPAAPDIEAALLETQRLPDVRASARDFEPAAHFIRKRCLSVWPRMRHASQAVADAPATRWPALSTLSKLHGVMDVQTSESDVLQT